MLNTDDIPELIADDDDDGLTWWESSTITTGVPPLTASALMALVAVTHRGLQDAAATRSGTVQVSESGPVVALTALSLVSALRTYARENPGNSNALHVVCPISAAALLVDEASTREVAALRPPATGDAVPRSATWERTRPEAELGALRPGDAAALDAALAGEDVALGDDLYRGRAAIEYMRSRAHALLTGMADMADWDDSLEDQPRDPLQAGRVWGVINTYGLRLGWYECPDLSPFCVPEETAGA